MVQQHFSSSDTKSRLDRVMEPEQFNQVIDAILAGKYSLACVLILQFGGYNPLHYIPYRTYNRIVKDRCQVDRQSESASYRIHSTNKHIAPVLDSTSPVNAQKIKDLSYFESANDPSTAIKGGQLKTLEQWLDLHLQKHHTLSLSWSCHIPCKQDWSGSF